MITRNTLGAIALATACLVPLAAFAQGFPTQETSTATQTFGPGFPPEETPSAAQAAAQATAPYTGYIGIGIMGLMGNNPNMAGRYNGLNTSGLDILGQFDLRGGAAWDSGGTRYYELYGNNLVFQTGNRLGSGIGSDSNWASSTTNSLINNGSVGFKVGDQGTWETAFDYSAITYTGNVIDSLYTVNGNKGVLNNNLAPFGGAGLTSAGSTTSFTGPQLAATGAMQPVQVGTRRDILSGGGTYILGNWTFTVAVRHEHKEGSLEESFDGTYGGTAFALPIDYDTDRYDASAAYTTRLFQGSIQYTFSHFSDNNSFVTLPYAVSNLAANGTAGPCATYSSSTGKYTAAPCQMAAAYSTPPSNEAHYVTIMLATDAVPNTRLNLNARVGLEKQDDTFPPNTADPNAASSLANTAGFLNLNSLGQGTGLSTSPDITATVYQVKVSAASHPIVNTDIDAFYGVDGRSVSMNSFCMGGNGVCGSGTGSDSAPSSATPYAFVVPQDWTKQNGGAEVSYRVLPASNTRLTVGYRFDAIDRSNAQVGSSWTNKASVAVLSNIGTQLNGKVSFDYTDRSGSLSYLTPWYNLDGVNASPTYSGAYYQAPMTSEAVTARLDYTPLNNLSADFFLQFKNENYTYPAAYNYTAPSGTVTVAPLTGVGGGVKQDQALVLGPDFDWRPAKNVNLHLFYTYEMLFFNNIGNGACATSNTGTCLGSAGYFQNQDTTGTHTVGLSGDWKVNDKLKLKADYTFSYGSVMFGEYNGVFVATPTLSYQNVTNYPDYDTVMHNVRLTAIYALAPNMDLVGQVSYAYLYSNDWRDNASAIQGAGTTAVSILTPGYASPTYSVLMLMTGVRFKL